MSYSTEAKPEPAAPDPHFNRLFALAGLSQAALQGVIRALQAQEETRQTGISPHAPSPEDLLSHYIQHPERPQENHAA